MRAIRRGAPANIGAVTRREVARELIRRRNDDRVVELVFYPADRITRQALNPFVSVLIPR